MAPLLQQTIDRACRFARTLSCEHEHAKRWQHELWIRLTWRAADGDICDDDTS